MSKKKLTIIIPLIILLAGLGLALRNRDSKPQLGGIELTINDKKSAIDTEQSEHFATKNKYKHIPWTVEGNVRYRVDESVYPDGSASYKKTIGSWILTDFTTATGTTQRYVFTQYE